MTACSLVSDYVFHLKLFFPSTNQVFHQVGCLLAFEAFNITSVSARGKLLEPCTIMSWLNSLILLGTTGTQCYQPLHALEYLFNYTLAMVKARAYHLLKIEHIVYPQTFTWLIKQHSIEQTIFALNILRKK